MDVQQLAALREVVAQGSVTAAAAVLHRTPSAVSQQLKALERSVGTPLLERAGRGVRPTPAGLELSRAAADVATAMAKAQATADGFRTTTTGVVRLCAFQSAAELFLPSLLRHVATDIELVCSEQDVAQHRFAALTADHDVVIAHRPSRSHAWDASVHVTPLIHEPLDVALPLDHRLADRAGLSPRDLQGERWITVHESFPVAAILHDIADHTGSPPAIVHRFNDFHVAAALVAAGHGVALLPRFSTSATLPLVLLPLAGVRANRQIDALTRPERRERPAVRHVLTALRGVARSVQRGDHRRDEEG